MIFLAYDSSHDTSTVQRGGLAGFEFTLYWIALLKIEIVVTSIEIKKTKSLLNPLLLNLIKKLKTSSFSF